MAGGYRIIGAGIFPLQGIPLQWVLRNATNRCDLEPIPPPWVALPDCAPRYRVPVFSGERSWKL